MRMAVVKSDTGDVANFVNAEPWNVPPVGCWLVEVPADAEVTYRHKWSAEAGFYPNAELQAELDAAEQAEETEGLTF